MQNKLLHSQYIEITNKVKVAIPKFGDVYKCEVEYLTIAHHLTDMPFSRMAELWINKIDYSQITFYDLFVQAIYELQILCSENQERITMYFGDGQKRIKNLDKMFFYDLDIHDLLIAKNANDEFLIISKSSGEVVFTQDTMDKTADAIRKIIGEQKDLRKEDIGGASGRYVLDRAVKVYKRELQKQKMNPRQYSALESYIVAMVNMSDFKYDFESVMNISYVQFVLSLKQLMHIKHVENIALGIYTGNIDIEKIDKQCQNYFSLEN